MIGSVVRQYRQKREVDQIDLASLLNVSQGQMSRLESGGANFSTDQIFILADYFNAPEILLQYIQPFLDRALEMSGAIPRQPEKCLIELMESSVSEISMAISSNDSVSAAEATSRLIALAQVVRILVSR